MAFIWIPPDTQRKKFMDNYMTIICFINYNAQKMRNLFADLK